MVFAWRKCRSSMMSASTRFMCGKTRNQQQLALFYRRVITTSLQADTPRTRWYRLPAHWQLFDRAAVICMTQWYVVDANIRKGYSTTYRHNSWEMVLPGPRGGLRVEKNQSFLKASFVLNDYIGWRHSHGHATPSKRPGSPSKTAMAPSVKSVDRFWYIAVSGPAYLLY